MNEHLERCIKALQIPKEFDWDEDFKTREVHAQLARWKDLSVQALQRIANSAHEPSTTSSKDVAHITYLVASFAYTERWCSETHRKFALEYLDHFAPHDSSLLTTVLTEHVKPLFVATPHPLLNPETGRKLPRPAGGAHSTQDMYDDQLWKANIGIASVLRFCIEQLSAPDLEQRWPLVIPPIITLSDDREGKWRLRILPIISMLLDKAPPELLRRTGIQTLLHTSLNNTLLFTGNPESAMLVEQGVPVTLKLIANTTRQGTEERFDLLRNLLGKSIIGSLWVYTTKDLESMKATYLVLPSVLNLFGIGSVIYLKAMIPQLAFHICPQPMEAENYPLVTAALTALMSVIEHCSPRINGWRWSILDCVCKRWATTESNTKSTDMHSTTVKDMLRSVCLALEVHCPRIREEEYDRIVKLDPDLFQKLFSPSNVP